MEKTISVSGLICNIVSIMVKERRLFVVNFFVLSRVARGVRILYIPKIETTRSQHNARECGESLYRAGVQNSNLVLVLLFFFRSHKIGHGENKGEWSQKHTPWPDA
jgi:hypothetical protein